jgi:hypothetical protein
MVSPSEIIATAGRKKTQLKRMRKKEQAVRENTFCLRRFFPRALPGLHGVCYSPFRACGNAIPA